jgi:quinol monooxygenase YgiN
MTKSTEGSVQDPELMEKTDQPRPNELRSTPNAHTSRRGFVAVAALTALALKTRALVAQSQRRTGMQVMIREGNAPVTLINVFTVEPAQQEKLIELLKEGTDSLFSKQPGFVAASFHKSLDGRRVVNYGQWQSLKDIEAFRARTELGEYFKQVAALSQVETMICEVSYVSHA